MHAAWRQELDGPCQSRSTALVRVLKDDLDSQRVRILYELQPVVIAQAAAYQERELVVARTARRHRDWVYRFWPTNSCPYELSEEEALRWEYMLSWGEMVHDLEMDLDLEDL